MTREEIELKYEPQYLGGEAGAIQRKEFRIMLDEIYDEFEKQLEKYKEPYDYDKIKSSDLKSGSGYIDGHAWVGRVKPNTTYEILVIEAKDD